MSGLGGSRCMSDNGHRGTRGPVSQWMVMNMAVVKEGVAVVKDLARDDERYSGIFVP